MNARETVVLARMADVAAAWLGRDIERAMRIALETRSGVGGMRTQGMFAAQGGMGRVKSVGRRWGLGSCFPTDAR